MIRRRRYRVRPLRRRRRRFRRLRRTRPIGSGDSGKRFFKLRRSDDLVMEDNTSLSIVRQDNPSTAQDWTSVSGLFDYYKVCAIKIHFIPAANINTFPAAAAGPKFTAVYVFHDVNTTSAVTGINNVIQYENMVVKNLWLPWKKYYRMVRNIPVTNAVTVSTRGYIPTVNPVPTQSVQVYIPTAGTSTSGLLGTLITTYYIVCRNRS